MTEPGGPAWRQTTFHPFAITSRLAAARRSRSRLESPTYTTEVYGEVPLVDAVATTTPRPGPSRCFLVNRNQTDAHHGPHRHLRASGRSRVKDPCRSGTRTSTPTNTLEDPERVALKPNDSAVIDGHRLTVTLPRRVVDGHLDRRLMATRRVPARTSRGVALVLAGLLSAALLLRLRALGRAPAQRRHRRPRPGLRRVGRHAVRVLDREMRASPTAASRSAPRPTAPRGGTAAKYGPRSPRGSRTPCPA